MLGTKGSPTTTTDRSTARVELETIPAERSTAWRSRADFGGDVEALERGLENFARVIFDAESLFERLVRHIFKERTNARFDQIVNSILGNGFISINGKCFNHVLRNSLRHLHPERAFLLIVSLL